MHSFRSDLDQEHILATYLDTLYHNKGITFERISDLEKQLQGIDLIILQNGVEYIIDEKAQLHYLNKSLPTFTFELSYLKDDKLKEGWFFDQHKSTQYYFLITAIYLKDSKQTLQCADDIKDVKITSVNREKLIAHLNTIGLDKEKLHHYDTHLREDEAFGKNVIPELNAHTQGLIYYTQQLVEHPMNLQLRLKYLIDHDIAKKFHYV